MNDELIITKTLTTRCIGYRHNGQGGLDTVYEYTVVFADGTEGLVWEVEPAVQPRYQEFDDPRTRTKPHIDTPSAITRKDTAQ